MAKKKPPMRTSGAKKKLSYDLTPRAHDLLKAESAATHVPQNTLLELMIRKYCRAGTAVLGATDEL